MPKALTSSRVVRPPPTVQLWSALEALLLLGYINAPILKMKTMQIEQERETNQPVLIFIG